MDGWKHVLRELADQVSLFVREDVFSNGSGGLQQTLHSGTFFATLLLCIVFTLRVVCGRFVSFFWIWSAVASEFVCELLIAGLHSHVPVHDVGKTVFLLRQASSVLVLGLCAFGWIQGKKESRIRRKTKGGVIRFENGVKGFQPKHENPYRRKLAERARERSVLETSYDLAVQLDKEDPLRSFRDKFHVPEKTVYLCGNSLGLQPKNVRGILEEELDKWAHCAVEGHFEGKRPWFEIDDILKDHMAEIVGAKPSEVAVANSLTANVHFLLVPFYRPTAKRFKILIERFPFPSDMWALRSHISARGFNADEALLQIEPRDGENNIRTEDILALLRQRGDEIALVFFSGVQFMTGQAFEIEKITAAGHNAGCVVGWDLAHAAGNLRLQLHDWNVDFGCWCSYKYLNSGPGNLSGFFVHDRWTSNKNIRLERFAGWWGNKRETRFGLSEQFDPSDGAAGFQLSNPPIFAICAVAGSLEVFHEAGMDRLREKSLLLTSYLELLLDHRLSDKIEIITPRDPQQRGCQISIRVPGWDAVELQKRLASNRCVVDDRKPDIIRISPAPLYNTFTDVADLVEELTRVLNAREAKSPINIKMR
eukprot:ANDGO_06052.mRNA.1 Kynureninase